MLDPQNMGIDTKFIPLSYLGPEIMWKTCSEWRPFWNSRWRPKDANSSLANYLPQFWKPKKHFGIVCQLLPKCL